ncbi:MAG TPA: signal peptidase I [Chloroflexota bacterium]
MTAANDGPTPLPREHSRSDRSIADTFQEAPVPTEETRKRGADWQSFVLELLQTALLTLVIFLLIRTVVQNFKVEGSSMEPTLHHGQYLLINRLAYLRLDNTVLAQLPGLRDHEGPIYLFGPPQRGDIIVFRAPDATDRDLIKRVVALPGEVVEVRQRRVLVNGEPIPEPYIRALPNYDQPPQRVPPGHYYVLGDNRPFSSDSHMWGFVPEENIVGRAWLSYWPPGEWGLLPSAAYAQ